MQKCSFSTIILRIFVPFIISWSVHLSSRNFRSRNCASYPQELCVMTYLIRELSRLPDVINFPTKSSAQNTWVRLPYFTINTQVIHRFTFGTHLLSTYDVQNMFKGTIVLFKVLCALRIKENIHKPVC